VSYIVVCFISYRTTTLGSVSIRSILQLSHFRITLKDLLRCKQAHDFINCLINFFEFNRFETREEGGEDSSMQEEEGEENEESGDRPDTLWEVLSPKMAGHLLNT